MQERLPFKSHPPEGLLEEYAFQRQAEEQVAPLEEHLLACSRCQEALARKSMNTCFDEARQPRSAFLSTCQQKS